MAGSNEVNVSESKRVVPLHTWILISNFKLAYNMLRRPDGTFNRDLNEFLDRKVTANAVPVDGVYSFDTLDRPTGLLNRVYLPARDNEPQLGIAEVEKPLSASEVVPVIVFFHGGSFVHSSANSAIYDIFCRRLVQTCKAAVVSVNYRRSPEHRYPCAYDDGWTALKWVNSRAWLRSGKENDLKVHIYLAGDSSGGNIAHHVAVRAANENVEVLGNILLHPLFGGEERTESEKRLDGKYFVRIQDRDWYWRAYLPEGEDRDHPACNVFGPRSQTLEGINFPKSLVVVAGLDLVQDWQIGYVEGLKKYGHEVKLLYLEKATIGFYFLPNNEHFESLMDEMKSFINPNCLYITPHHRQPYMTEA
ncbi:LOW QUALITY PROTEIN: gibberellin receptor GID1C-like [Salvia hispanica]|uniref:LOW QUALITY PROTEIN: gibberellin receptor GID1C-like n=1 Tax=Salvia hispanica TaxID=49212 RepID=UPI002008F291|nr:LOW QUALITY PROTEIN: gibberellin receptor GID1C-like [Salvia hispanica]